MKGRIALLVVAVLAVCVIAGDGRMGEKGTGAPEAKGERIAGRCHCGHVRYEAQRPIVKCSYCDCRGCQRATGTFKAPFVTVLRTKFKVTAGKPKAFRAASGKKCDAHGVWHFCPKCGSQVFWKAHRGKELDIFAGTLDNTKLFRIKK